ncbi:hypothetical protein [Leadbetterella sp. DM7]|uniref:hypothetical protein n=1 Tax=Leadbetterella sp. DM7 TaxID=3235085 RepID=UPI00349EBD5D
MNFKNIEKAIWVTGGIIVIIIIWGTYATSKRPFSISNDLDVWKDRAEFIGIILGPYIAIVGAYYVWKTLDVQSEAKVVDAYGSVYSKLEAEFQNIVRHTSEWKSLIDAGRITEGSRLKIEINNTLCYLLKEYFNLNDATFRTTKHEKNIALTAIFMENFNVQFKAFLKERIGYKIVQDQIVIDDHWDLLLENSKTQIVLWYCQKQAMFHGNFKLPFVK